MATILRAVLGYVFLTLMVRVLKRRPGAQMTMAEFVLVFLMGGVIILATVGQDKSMTNCTCAEITVALMHRLTSYLKVRYPGLGRLLDGTPLLLMRRGELQHEMLRKMGLAEEDVMAAARLSGLRSLDQAEYAVLERNGGINVIKRKESGGG